MVPCATKLVPKGRVQRRKTFFFDINTFNMIQSTHIYNKKDIGEEITVLEAIYCRIHASIHPTCGQFGSVCSRRKPWGSPNRQLCNMHPDTFLFLSAQCYHHSPYTRFANDLLCLRAYLNIISSVGFLFFGPITHVEETIRPFTDRSPFLAAVQLLAEAFVRIHGLLSARCATLVFCGFEGHLRSVEVLGQSGVELFSTFNNAIECE